MGDYMKRYLAGQIKVVDFDPVVESEEEREVIIKSAKTGKDIPEPKKPKVQKEKLTLKKVKEEGITLREIVEKKPPKSVVKEFLKQKISEIMADSDLDSDME